MRISREIARQMVDSGATAATVLRAAGITIAEVMRRAEVSYMTAWQVSHEGTSHGPRSRRVQEVIDELLGFPYPWPPPDSGTTL
jgi:hypothetical protein